MLNYPQMVIDYFFDRRFSGEFAAATDVVEVQVGEAGITDVVRLAVKLDADQRITAAKFKAYGNPYTIAIMAWLAETLPGQSMQQLAAINYQQLVDYFNIPPIKAKSAVLIEAMLEALQQKVNL